MNVLRYSIAEDIQIKAEEKDFIIEGYGAIFGNIDSYKDVIVQGAFAKTIQERGDRIAFAEQHDIYSPVGKILELKEDYRGLWFKVRISDSEPKIKQKIKEGILKEFSIGYRPITTEKGMQDGVDVMYLKEIELFEISVVTIAANPEATLEAIKAEDRPDFIESEFDKVIALAGRKTELKYELLKLKTLLVNQPPAQSTEPPLEPEVSELNIKEFKL